MKLEDFKLNQRVQQFDEYENKNDYGTVVKIESGSVFIQWDGIKDVVQHDDPEDMASIDPRIAFV